MKNMEREKFEESLRNAFDQAGVSPSDNVWTNIELDLEKEKGGHLKRRLMFYQMLAAASVVFAMAIGGYALYYTSQNQPSGESLAMQTPVRTETLPATDDATDPSGRTDLPVESSAANTATQSATPQKNDRADLSEKNTTTSKTAFQVENKKDLPTAFSTDRPTDMSAVLASVEGDRPLFPDLPLTIDDKNLPSFYEAREIGLTIPGKTETSADPVAAMLARLEVREKEVSGEQKDKKSEPNENENLWTSIGFAAGSFNVPNSSVSSSPQRSFMASNAPIVEKEAQASGYSYSMGVNVGTKLSERWVFQGGVNYMTQASDYTSQNAVAVSSNFESFRPMASNDVLKAEAKDNLSEKIVSTAPYNITNSLRYLSIPMQAGYLLVNKSFGLQLNAGIATDLFLQNTVKADGDRAGDNLHNTTQSGGADSPYRSVNLSGLLGTELSYRFGDHYRVALNPGIRYPFNTIYKSEMGVQATPLTFDVGLRFRYIFH